MEIACTGGGMDESDAIAVEIVAPPGTVEPTLLAGKVNGDADIHFTWTDTTSADDYVVFEDPDPAGTFATQTGTAPDGTTGLVTPIPGGALTCYLVAGRNPTCGLGAKR